MNPRRLQWSTDDVGPADRFAYWREAICDAFLDLRPEAEQPAHFEGSITVERRELVEIARIESSAQLVRRRPAHDGGWCYLNVQRRGVGRTTQAGVDVVTHPGDAVLVRTDRPFEFRFDDAFCQLSIRLPASVDRLVTGPLLVPARSSHGGALSALLGLTAVATDELTYEADPSLDPWLDRALVELVRSALRPAPTDRRRWTDPWTAIDADIEHHLRSPTLTPSATARRVGMSVRSLHHAFESRPRTFAREVRHRRLQLARRMLLDPRYDQLRLRDVAADVGLLDLQHFQRAYRQTFGETPGTTRRDRD
ncbi:MAG: helix-turn-helix domain-containing protein [Actinomycetota bacterium]